jgi:hypothetical protein
MRRHAIIGALLLIGLGVILGATVFRTDIAQATGLAQSVTVTNTPAQAIPVREQNLDGGNIKVHEQGTANVTGTVGLSSSGNTVKIDGSANEVTAAMQPATRSTALALANGGSASFGEITASLVIVNMGPGVERVNFSGGIIGGLDVWGPAALGGGSAHVVLPLTQPINVSHFQSDCPSGNGCGVNYMLAGR